MKKIITIISTVIILFSSCEKEKIETPKDTNVVIQQKDSANSINLIGDDTIVIACRIDSYNDPGIKLVNYHDFSTVGKVNVDSAGIYKLKYVANDSSGASDSIFRTVIVKITNKTIERHFNVHETCNSSGLYTLSINPSGNIQNDSSITIINLNNGINAISGYLSGITGQSLMIPEKTINGEKIIGSGEINNKSCRITISYTINDSTSYCGEWIWTTHSGGDDIACN